MRAALLALAVGARAQFEIDLDLGEMPVFVMDEAPSSFFPPGMEELMSMVDQLQQMPSPMMQMARPMNPCEVDQARTGCRDVACLKSKAITSACASFLAASSASSNPEPSPSPTPSSNSFFSVSYLGEDGKMHTEEGRMSTKESKRMEGEMFSMLDLMMPGISELFEEPKPRKVQQPPKAKETSHPCEQEVLACSAELGGDTSRKPIQDCLISHYSELTAECKCTLHQLMGDELEKRVPGAVASEQPRMRTVAVEVVELEQPPYKGGHRFTCTLFMMMLALSLALVLRRLCYCCCAPKPKNIAFVPPVTVQPLVITKEIQ